MVVAIDPDGVIALSAATLATADDLADDGRALAATIRGVDHLVTASTPAVTSRIGTIAAGLADLAGWARQVALTYVDDEKPLRDLATLGYWLPDPSFGWDTSATLGQNVQGVLTSDEFGAVPLGLSGELFARYRLWALAMPRVGSGDALQTISDAALWRLPGQNLPTTSAFGTTWVSGRSGLLVPQGSLADPGYAVGLQAIDDVATPQNFTTAGKPSLTGDVTLGRPPTWARTAGRGLAIVGVGLTLYGAGVDQWEHDEQYHPDWSTEQKVASTAVNTAVVGGAAAAGGWAGAALGAKGGAALGAMIGSAVPGLGTAAGAVVGGIIGGVVGGFVGSEAGAAAGTWLKETGESLWKGMFG